MTVQELLDSGLFTVENSGENTDRKIESVYCCDLLSFAMGRAPSGCAWVTVMANVNTLAVAALTDAACIILAEGAMLDDAALQKMKQQQITVLLTELPIFDAALSVYQKLNV